MATINYKGVRPHRAYGANAPFFVIERPDNPRIDALGFPYNVTTPNLPHGHELPAEGSTEMRRLPRPVGALFIAVGLLAIPLVYVGCAGDLEKDPNAFVCAFADATDPKCGASPISGGSGGQGNGQGGNAPAQGGNAPTQGGMQSMGGSSSSGGASNAVIPPDDACVAQVFESELCTLCHSANPGGTGGGLSLVGSDLGKRLSMTQALYMGVSDAGKCVPGNLIIDPANPSNSLLLKKITNKQECGQSMPTGGTLEGDDLACIQGWIMKFKP